jgi:phosphatidylethanolamine/phosphatidyl-N-methylethanolamine N-methyltransferase
MPNQDKMLSKRYENILFLKRLLKNPVAMGAVFPSSKALAQFICRHVDCADGEFVVEIGAGTGRFTQALLDFGIPADKLISIELDSELVRFLKQKFPKITIIEGDATQLKHLLPPATLGRVRTVVSGIPMVNFPKRIQREIISSAFSILMPQGRFLQFTYGPISPLPARSFGLIKKRLGHILFNFPPATVWGYEKAGNQIIKRRFLLVKMLREKMKKKRFFVRNSNKNKNITEC